MTLLTDHSQAHRVGLAEFEQLRDERDGDGCRYELLAGEVLVTPGPATPHQIVSMALSLLIGPLVEPPLRLLTAPVDMVLPTPGGATLLQPDLVLARRADITPSAVVGVPLLVVEILSPTTWKRDLGVKRDTYAQTGVEHYWVVSPRVPSLTVYRLGTDGAYREVTHVEGASMATITAPYRLRVSPADLMR